MNQSKKTAKGSTPGLPSLTKALAALTLLTILGVLPLLLLTTSCSGGSTSSIPAYEALVDLDKVSLALDDTIKEFSTSVTNDLDGTTENPTIDDSFVASFQTHTRTRTGKPNIGIHDMTDGSLLGYNDKNNDQSFASNEPKLFQIVFDQDGKRVVITDLQDPKNNRSYRGSGLFYGYFIGRMFSRQSSAGIASNRYSGLKDSPKGYYNAAESKNRANYHNRVSAIRSAKSSSSRSYGGSRSFSGGK